MIKLSENANRDYLRFLYFIPAGLTKRGKTQKDLALYLSIDPASLSRIINGQTTPSIYFYFGVVEFFSLFPVLPNYE